MQLQCVLHRVDFVPMIKTNTTFWQSPETLKFGTKISVEPQIGYQLMAMYPEAFKIIEDQQPQPVRRKKAVDPAQRVERSTRTGLAPEWTLPKHMGMAVSLQGLLEPDAARRVVCADHVAGRSNSHGA